MTRKSAEVTSQTVLWLEGFKAGQVALMREVMGNLAQEAETEFQAIMPTTLSGVCLFCGTQVVGGTDGPRYLPPQPHHPSCVWLVSQ